MAISKRTGKRCRIKTCVVGPKCWIHTKFQDGLIIKKSAIAGAGKGLMTTVPRKAYSRIAEYTGELLTSAQVNARYPGAALGEYTIKAGYNNYIDARNTNSGPARYANTCDAPAGMKRVCRNNATLAYEVIPGGRVKKTRRKHRVWLEVCPGANIPAGSEIFTSYGKHYSIGGVPVVSNDCA